jgi:beta-glucosidase
MKKPIIGWSVLCVQLLSSNGFAQALSGPSVQFPAGFKWCVASAGHQYEGNNIHSNWWHWEQANHAGDAQHCSGRSADHWNRVAEDVSLIESLGVQQFRMSIEWSRIEPQEGVIDQAALNHYRDEVRLLKSRGIEPLITLQHFTLPQWVAEKGGWEWEGMPDAFSRYSIRVYRAIRNEASIFITMNEPNLM